MDHFDRQFESPQKGAGFLTSENFMDEDDFEA